MADDYTANKNTTGVAVIGGSVTGSIETDGDKDWFSATFEKFYTYRIRVEWTDAHDHVYRPDVDFFNQDESNFYVKDNGANNGRIVNAYYQTTSGTPIFLQVDAYHVYEQGNYRLDIDIVDDNIDDKTTNGFVSSTSNKYGAIETAGDVDWISTQLVQGRKYTFDMLGLGPNQLADTSFQLVDEDGNVIASDLGFGDNSSSITYRAVQDRRAYLAVKGNSGQVGTYKLSASIHDDYAADNSTTAFMDLNSGETVGEFRGDIENSGDKDWVKVEMEFGKWYQFNLTGVSNYRLHRFKFDVFSSTGDQLLTRTGYYSAQKGFYATYSGSFFVQTSSYTTSTGKYKLSISETPAPTVVSLEKTIQRSGRFNLFDTYRYNRGIRNLNSNTVSEYELYHDEGKGGLYTNDIKRATKKRFKVSPADLRKWSVKVSSEALTTDWVYMRARVQNVWTNWVRHSFRSTLPFRSIANGQKVYSSYQYRKISFNFASKSPTYVAKDTYESFSGLNGAQKTAIRNILAKISSFSGAQFIYSGEESAQMVFGRADLGTRDYLANPPERFQSDSTVKADVVLNFKSAEFRDPKVGSRGYVLLMQAIGQALGLRNLPLGYSAEKRNSETSIMFDDSSARTSGINATNFSALDMSGFRKLYGKFQPANPQGVLKWTQNGKMLTGVGPNFVEIDASKMTSNVVLRLGNWQESYAGTITNSTHLAITETSNLVSARGGRGDDVIVGNGKDNNIVGASGNDRIRGLRGDDILKGRAGNDRYNWVLGDGNDTIAETGGTETIGIKSWYRLSHLKDDVTFLKDKNDFVISLDFNGSTHRTSGSIRIKNMNLTNAQVEKLTLIDGNGVNVGPTVSLVSAWNAVAAENQDNKKFRLTFSSSFDDFGRIVQVV